MCPRPVRVRFITHPCSLCVRRRRPQPALPVSRFVGNLCSSVLARSREEQHHQRERHQAQRVRPCVPVSVALCIRPARCLVRLGVLWAAARWVPLPVPRPRLQGVQPDVPVRRLAVRDSAMFHAESKKVR